MENTIADTRPTFARLTEGRATQSWRSATPAVLIVVAFAALLAYLASSLSSAEQKAMSAERENAQIREQQTGINKQITNLQKDNALAKAPGRTTVILDPADGKKAKDSGKAWAAATWAELPDGKSMMRINAYGLGEKPDSGSYHAWMVPLEGDPIDLGELDADQNGSAFSMATELPAVDQGKQVLMTIDQSGAKQPGETVAKADLPQLKPAPVTIAAPADTTKEPQAKSGSDSQKMHQEKPAEKPAEQPGK